MSRTVLHELDGHEAERWDDYVAGIGELRLGNDRPMSHRRCSDCGMPGHLAGAWNCPMPGEGPDDAPSLPEPWWRDQ